MSNKPVLDAALNAAAMCDLRHQGNRSGVEAYDRAAEQAAVRRI
jgi:hypothetical protein